MQPEQFLQLANFILWGLLAVIVLGESYLVNEVWPEERRWRLGYVTLFGATLAMVARFGWDGRTWAGLVLLSGLTHWLEIEQMVIDDLWKRRESHRWTAQYFAAFVAALPLVAAGYFDLGTWGATFFSLGMCGAMKVGYEGVRDARRARAIRRKSRAVQMAPPTEGQDAV